MQENYVDKILKAKVYDIAVETLTTTDETVFFPLPRALREEAAPGEAASFAKSAF